RELARPGSGAVQRAERDERRNDDRADDRDETQAVVEPLRLSGLGLHPQHLVEPPELEELTFPIAEIGAVDETPERRLQLVAVRLTHCGALPEKTSSRSQASEFRSRTSTTWTSPDAASAA